MIRIYGKPACPQCVQAKKMCEQKKIEYTYLELDVDYTVEELREMCPAHISSLPQIFDGDKYIGGIQVFTKYLAGELKI